MVELNNKPNTWVYNFAFLYKTKHHKQQMNEFLTSSVDTKKARRMHYDGLFNFLLNSYLTVNLFELWKSTPSIE